MRVRRGAHDGEARKTREHLRYAATYRGEWLAVVSFSAGASHRRYRDQFIGWSPEQRRRRLPLVVNNARFLILPDAHYPHLASRLLTRVLARLSDDWLARLGAPGRARRDFRQSGVLPRHHLQGQRLERIGRDLGVRPARQDFYEPHERPKQLWVKALVKGACQQLRAPQLSTAWALVATHAPVRCTTPVRAIGSLLEEGRSLPEFRRRQALAYPVAGMVALIVLATFCDVMRGQRDLAAFARKRSQAQLRALGFSCDRTPGACGARARRRFSACWARCRPTRSKPCSCAGRQNSSVR